MISPNEIRQMVETKLTGSHVEVRDMAGDGEKFEIVVVSSAFEGQGLVDRHRMVYSALGNAVGGTIHAAALKTFTPDEHEKGKGK